MRRLFILAGVAATMLVASFAGAHAQQPMPRVQVGILECRGGASIGFVVGSVTHLGCVLRADGMPEDRYIATIRKVGLDLGITQESALAWGVFAPVARLGPGGLSGDYAGAQGSATLGVGVGGNVLVGGSANSIALQPLSVQGQVGVGDPVVFLHAAVCDSRMWRAQLDAVGASNKAIAYDRRGFGETHAAKEDFSSVADLLAVIDAVGNGAPAILVGCSQGGRVAL